MDSPTSNGGRRTNCARRFLLVATFSGLSLCVLNSNSPGQETTPARQVGADSVTAQSSRDFLELLKLEAERSEKAMQATSDSMRAYTDLLRAEAGRSEEANRHEIDMVERTLAKFTYIIGGLFTVVSALLVFFGWGTLKEIRRRAENTVENEIQKQAKAADAKITEHVELVKSKVNDSFVSVQRDFVRIQQEFKSVKEDFKSGAEEDLTLVTMDLVRRQQPSAPITTGGAQPEYERTPSPQKKWMIWVDDQPKTTLTARKELLRNGIQVEAVESTKDLEELLANPPKDKKFDLIVSDMRRGTNKREGLDFLQKIKGQKSYPPRLIFSPSSLLQSVENEIQELKAADDLFLGAFSAREPVFANIFKVMRGKA